MNSSAVGINATYTVTLTIGTWYFISATWDTGGTMTLYLNGSSVATNTSTGTYSLSMTPRLTIGTWWDSPLSGTLKGKVDEVGIWSRALSSSEITELYNSGTGLSYPFTTFNPAFARRRLLLRK